MSKVKTPEVAEQTVAGERKKQAAAEKAAKPVRAVRTRLAALVLPTYSLKQFETGDSFAIRVTSEITKKPDIDQKDGTQKKNKDGSPAELSIVNVVDLDTDEYGEMVLPIIIQHAFEKFAVLSGECFELVKGKAEANKATKWEVHSIAGE